MIIGLSGKMRAGKNTAAERLAVLAPPVVEVSFAAKLKQSAAALLGVPVETIERWKNEPLRRLCVTDPHGLNESSFISQTVRSFLQRYGTEAHRDVFGQDFWLDAALPMVGKHSPAPLRSVDVNYNRALYVVTDVRFPNEAQRVRDLGGLMVKITGPETDTGGHASEQELDCDYTINNVVRTDGYRALDGQLMDLLYVARGGSVAA